MISPCPETEYTSLHSRLVYFFLVPSGRRRGSNHARWQAALEAFRCCSP